MKKHEHILLENRDSFKPFKNFILEATNKSTIDIPLEHIHREGGHHVNEYEHTPKVKSLRQSIRDGKKIPPVEVTRITPSLRKSEGITDPKKKWFLVDGNHRFAAHHFEGKTHIRAKNFYADEEITKD